MGGASETGWGRKAVKDAGWAKSTLWVAGSSALLGDLWEAVQNLLSLLLPIPQGTKQGYLYLLCHQCWRRVIERMRLQVTLGGTRATGGSTTPYSEMCALPTVPTQCAWFKNTALERREKCVCLDHLDGCV